MKNKPPKMLKARVCYGHLGGTLGERLFNRLVELEWLKPDRDKATVYELTEEGIKQMINLGVNIYERR